MDLSSIITYYVTKYKYLLRNLRAILTENINAFIVVAVNQNCGGIMTLEINYNKLQSFLSAENLQQADLETNRLLQTIEDEERNYRRRTNRWDYLAHEAINEIDRLWIQLSGGRFGFTVQTHLYQQCGGTNSLIDSGLVVWKNFCKEVGWLSSSYDDSIISQMALAYHVDNSKLRSCIISDANLNFSFNAPDGHLPSFAKKTMLIKFYHSPFTSIGGSPERYKWDFGDILYRLK